MLALQEHGFSSRRWRECLHGLGFFAACGYPMTLFFAREVGKILSEFPDGEDRVIQPSYRFYI